MPKDAADAFIERWASVSGSELANYQLFILELCQLLDVPEPQPASDDTRDNVYVFQRRVTFDHADGTSTPKFIDCYRRESFVLEAKKLRQGAATKAFDDAMLRARSQAEGYARAVPASEGRPPFLVIVDVGRMIELWAEFSRSGGVYTPFPDSRSHRIKLSDLASPNVRERLRKVWLEPLELDPSRASARVTREVAAQLADIAKSLEEAGHPPQAVAAFLTRCLFSMFAEDVGLLPKRAFLDLLEKHRDKPAKLREMLRILWTEMDRGGFSGVLADKVLRFNGKLFKNSEGDSYALPLDREQVDSLLRAAQANWREVEPAIFGTLLERALDPDERHALGAHYTPRAYVERLVVPTIVEPLRADWADAQAAALLLAEEAAGLKGKAREAKRKEARAELLRFHRALCDVRVLDPACGSGNFLYVTLEHLKRLEGEVFLQLEALGKGWQVELGYDGKTVSLDQLRGIEINTRAAALAELVLWIGYLQWQIRTHGQSAVHEPVVHDFGNIECRDAVLAYDREEPALDPKTLRAPTRWDGRTFKKHPVTGEDVPDESAQVPLMRYVNPRKAEWPRADFIVGNPPYLGARTIRPALNDGYLESLRAVHPEMPDNVNLVMYWWEAAATLVCAASARGFGLITTNSIRQSFSNKVIADRMSRYAAFVIRFCIPDHPWVDASDGADVRVALTVCDARGGDGRLLTVVGEEEFDIHGEALVSFREQIGHINSDLTVGVDLSSVPPLAASQGVSCVGYQLTGQGFVVDVDTANQLRDGSMSFDEMVRPLLTGRDITQSPRKLFAIDAYGAAPDKLRANHPKVFQWLSDHVKPERDQNARASLRDKWWVFGEPRSTFRPALAGTVRCVATSLTAKFRTFQFVESRTVCDSSTVMIALPDGLHLGVLSSQAHIDWSLAAGGRLGVGNDPRYTKSRCFETFPFPDDDTGLTAKLQARIRELAEQLDAHRKKQQAAHDELTLTGMYNVLEKLRAGEALSPKEKRIHELGLVSVLRTLHDELDAAVLTAYGWSDLGSVPWKDEAARAAWTEKLLERLVALNHKRAAEEAAFERGEPGGRIRWLRPEFQDPARRAAAPKERQRALALDDQVEVAPTRKGEVAAALAKRKWPTTLPEQMRAVAEVLGGAATALDEDALAAHFTSRVAWKTRLPQILRALEALGRARESKHGWRGA